MNRRVLRACALVSLFSGMVIILVILTPIAKYEIVSRQKYPVLISPVETSLTGVLGWEIRDTTKIENWLADGGNLSEANLGYQYFLSIERLKIKDAHVLVGGEDLSKTLIHYPGTALPGKIGNSVIFGHSVLPIFYNPKDYHTIFSTMPSLDKGDIIEVKSDGILFKYMVENMYEVYPSDLSVLRQDKNNSYITLITCVPPGDPRMPRRLVVRAKVVPIN